MWMAARATTIPDWEKAMNQIKTYDVEGWKDLEKLNHVAQTRYAFKLNTKYDLQVNMCEAFNNVIMEYRDKPIIILFEGIQFYISSRIVKLRTILMRYEGMICPKIQQIIEKNKKKLVKHNNHIGLVMLICLCLRCQRAQNFFFINLK